LFNELSFLPNIEMLSERQSARSLLKNFLVDHNVEEIENQQQQNLIPIEQLCKMISENPATLLPAAALIFGSASITTTTQQPEFSAEEGGGTFYLKEENEYEEDKVEEEQNNFEGQNEQQSTQDAAEAAANLISFLMESTNNSNNLAGKYRNFYWEKDQNFWNKFDPFLVNGKG